MTLFSIIKILEQIALLQPNIRTVSSGSIFESLNTNPNIEYDVFHVSQTSHRLEDDVDFFGFNLFFVSRLDDTMENNRLTIQSIGKGVLTNIIKVFCEDYGAIELPILRFYPFQQRFQDECAGVYCSVEIGVPVDWVCEEDDFGNIGEIVPSKDYNTQSKRITVTENGTYTIRPDAGFDGLSRVTVEVDVEGGEARLYDLTATTNSTYTPAPGFDGFGKVVVDVPTGAEARLGNLSINEEGEVHRTVRAQDRGLDGFSSVTVNVMCDECDCSSAYTQGYNDGVEDQKDKLTTLTVTKNGQYTRGDGYSAITVNVSGDCSSAYTQGYNDAKAELTELQVTENGGYLGEYSAVTVNVGGQSAETSIITYQPIEGVDRALLLDSRVKFYDGYGVQRPVISHVYDSTTDTGTITISGKITKIENWLFNYPNSGATSQEDEQGKVFSVTLPSAITYIGDWVFNGCENMIDFVFPDVEYIGKNAFANCLRLERIQLPETCKMVASHAFYLAGDLTGSDNATVLYCWPYTYYADAAFRACGMAEIYLPTTGAPESDLTYFPQIYYDANPAYSPLRHTYDTFNGVSTDLHIHIGNPRRQLPYYWQKSFPNCTYDNDLYDPNKH